MSNDTRNLLGVISDTHGLVRPQALDALAGVDLILHAGDIGNHQVLDTLNQIAPVVAVRGNNDKGDLATPFVVGVVALLLQRDPQLDPVGVKNLLRAASSIPNQAADAFSPKWGFGLINALGL